MLDKTYESQEAALNAINAREKKAVRQGGTLSMKCPGNTLLLAEGLLNLEDFPVKQVAGQWSIDFINELGLKL